jgi:hypothetical protein
MGRHLLIWLMIVFFTPLALPMLLNPKLMTNYIRIDYNSAVIIFGEKEEINRDIVYLYKKNLAMFAVFVNEFRDKNDDSNKFRSSGDHIGEAIANIPGDWAASVKLQIYSMALRIVVLKLWGIWIITPIIIGFVAGAITRKMKFATFSSPAPPIYNTSVHMLLALVSMIILWILCPIPIPLSIVPTIAMLLSVLISMAVAHYPNY